MTPNPDVRQDAPAAAPTTTPAPTPAPSPTVPAQRRADTRRQEQAGRRRRPVALVVAAALTVAAGAGTAVWLGTRDGADPATAAGATGTGTESDGGTATGPLEVPASIGGAKAVPEAQDIGLNAGYREVVAEQLGGAEYVTRQYGTAADRRYVRVFAAKTDLTGKLELGWAADEGTTHGDFRCTQNIAPPGAKAGVRETVLLCWRTSADLSVYAMAVDFDAPPKPTTVLPALTALWSTATGSA